MTKTSTASLGSTRSHVRRIPSTSSSAHVKILRGQTAETAPSAISIGTFDTLVAHSDSFRDPAETHEAIRRSAFEQGYAEGLEQAREDIATATADANNRVRHALGALQAAIDGFDHRDGVGLADIENTVVEIAASLATEILQRELTVMTSPGAEAIARAMQFAPTRGQIVARLHPSDVETLGTTTFEAQGRNVDVIADASIERGGCILDVGDVRVDAQISTAMQHVRIALGVDDKSALFGDASFIDEDAIAHARADRSSKTESHVKKLGPAASGRSPKRSRKTSSEAPDES